MLRLNNVSCGWGGAAVLSGLSVGFGPGRLSAVIGKNGSGKSTLLKTLARQIPPLSGGITLEERDVFSYPVKEYARRVSYLPQVRAVPNIACGALVAHGRFPYLGFPRVLSAADREAAEQAMRRMRVDRFRDTLVSKLSGGERQRVYLAMQLCQDTDVMLLDEPTTHLDLRDAYALLEELHEIARRKTVIVVLHDLAAALRYCDDVYLLNGGALASSGTSREVFASGALQRAYRVRAREIEENGERHYLFSLDE